jgi:hypothetical protein
MPCLSARSTKRHWVEKFDNSWIGKTLQAVKLSTETSGRRDPPPSHQSRRVHAIRSELGSLPAFPRPFSSLSSHKDDGAASLILTATLLARRSTRRTPRSMTWAASGAF